MEYLPWWTEDQKKLADEVNEFIDELMPRIDEAYWKKEFPFDLVDKIADRGYFGAGVPEEYGGMGLGATGSGIIVEALGRLGGFGSLLVNTLLAGLHQLIHFGTEEQRQKWLPKIAKGELAGIAITEPFAGSDVAAMQLKAAGPGEIGAKKEGESYIVTGKKRYVSGSGIVRRYLVYARTSDKPEDIKKYRHLTAFICEKDMPGFTVEKINEFPGVQGGYYNGYLSFDRAEVPAGNRIGAENEGWRVAMVGLNYERILGALHYVGCLRDMLKTVLWYTDRRIQFGVTTNSLQANQHKIADIITRMRVSRVFSYNVAHLFDSGIESPLDTAIAKLICSKAAFECTVDAIQVMGGDGSTKFYPVSRILMLNKIGQIGGGSDEIIKNLIFAQGKREMSGELREFSRKWHRVTHAELGVPVIAAAGPNKRSLDEEEDLLKELADDYRVNPGLFMLRE
ncbi:acyl-CoA dehydrogenase family protein, partial [Thermodesulfobacteriota bacterium]